MRDRVEEAFRGKVDKALSQIRLILHNERNPTYAENVEHTYADKFALSEFLTKCAAAGYLNVLEVLGVNEESLLKMKEWSQDRSVTIRFSSEERCQFDRKDVKEVEKDVAERKTRIGSFFSNVIEKVIGKVTTYYWNFTFNYEISVYRGNNPEEKIVLQTRKGKVSVASSSDVSPHPEVKVNEPIELNITWLLQHLICNQAGGDKVVEFSINRASPDCHMPTNNKEVLEACRFFGKSNKWAMKVFNYFQQHLFPIQPSRSHYSERYDIRDVLVPILPLFESTATKKFKLDSPASKASDKKKGQPGSLVISPAKGYEGSEADSPLLTTDDVSAMLFEQRRLLGEQFKDLSKELKTGDRIISTSEVNLLTITNHLRNLGDHYISSLKYIEEMMKQQLLTAIGKALTPLDFDEYMEYHYRKLFIEEAAPTSFAHAVRRPEFSPEGIISIEATTTNNGTTLTKPIRTFVSPLHSSTPMKFAINAATTVDFNGDRYLHGWMLHDFSDRKEAPTINLVARARQFSSFVLLAGRIVSKNVFSPSCAIVLRNKDVVKIPLLLETIPSAKAFKEAISSLSEEMQRFSSAFRSMQLESTLFGVALLQIKPQVEKLMNLPRFSLTKELSISESIIKLIITYQIPSDLFAYNGPDKASATQKIASVERSVESINRMIAELRAEQLAEEERRRKQQELEERRRREAEERLSLQKYDVYECESISLCCDMMDKSVKRKKGGRSMQKKKMVKSKEKKVAKRKMDTMEEKCKEVAEEKCEEKAPKENTMKLDDGEADGDSRKDAPQDVDQQEQQEQEHEEDKEKEYKENEQSKAALDEDVTQIPARMDGIFEKLDKSGAVRPTIINMGQTWTKTSRATILSKEQTQTLNVDQQKEEREKAYDLLDCLSKCGGLSFDEASFHVVIANSHCFDDTLIDTVIRENKNPIEEVERTAIILSSLVHRNLPHDLIRDTEINRLDEISPMLFEEETIKALSSN